MSNPIQNSEYLMLRDAVKRKDKVTARNAILNNVSVNVSNEKYNTPLHWAITNFEDLEIMTMLLDRGANIHAINYHKRKPLQVAIENTKIEAVQLLIKRGALIDENLNSLLLIAIEKNNAEIFKVLIDNGMQYNPSIRLNVPLNAATTLGQLEIIEHILPYYKIFEPSDQYLPKQAVMGSGPQSEECVELLLKWNFTVNPDCKHDEDFIFTAVEKGYLPIICQLLNFGIDVNMANSKTGLNLLKIACIKKHHAIAEIFLKNNACVNTTTPTNTEILNNLSRGNSNELRAFINNERKLSEITCLHIAVLNSDLKMTELLLEYGATIVDDPTFFNITCIAVRFNCEEIVRMFLDRGVNVNDINSEGESLLHLCVLDKYCTHDHRFNMAKLLLEKGANILIQPLGNSLLFEAINNDNYKIAKLFLDYNAETHYINPNGHTPLHAAIENDFDVEFIINLLKHNSPVNVINNEMLTPLLLVFKISSKNQLKIIEALLEYNANVNCTDQDMMSPLHLACQNQNSKAVAVLLRRRANPNIKDNEGQTPLHIICNYENENALYIIQLLLNFHANINAVDLKGWTPLFIACKMYHDKTIQCLLDHGANVNRTDFEKLTPLYIASQNCKNNTKGIKILLECTRNIHCMDKQGNSIIHHIAATKNFSGLINYIARTQININSVNMKGNTPLHIAVNRKFVKMVEKLIKYGANVNIIDKKYKTPLKNAIDYVADYESTLDSILDYYGEYGSTTDEFFGENGWTAETYRSCIYRGRRIIKILKIQVIKLKVAGLKVNEQNLKIAYQSNKRERSYIFNDSSDNSDEASDKDEAFHENTKLDTLQLEIDFEREIEQMRTERIGVHEITFYDLLTKNIHYLSRFVKNKKILQLLELKEYDEKFPLYIDIVRNRFRDAKFRYRMMNSAKKYFTSNITQGLSDDCIDTVFSYLKIKEVKNFIRAMKSLNE